MTGDVVDFGYKLSNTVLASANVASPLSIFDSIPPYARMGTMADTTTIVNDSSKVLTIDEIRRQSLEEEAKQKLVDQAQELDMGYGPDWKFNEFNYTVELKDYIATTYKKHYVGKNNIQAFELIVSSGHGTGFAIGNVLKYGARYGKKEGRNRDDLLKILHYALLALYVHDEETAD